MEDNYNDYVCIVVGIVFWDVVLLHPKTARSCILAETSLVTSWSTV